MRNPQHCKAAVNETDVPKKSSDVRISRQPLPGYTCIKECEELVLAADGSVKVREVFYEVYHRHGSKRKRWKTKWATAKDAIAAVREEQAAHAAATHAAAGLFEQVSQISLTEGGAAITGSGKQALHRKAAPPEHKEHSNAGGIGNESEAVHNSGSADRLKAAASLQQLSDLITTASQQSYAGGKCRALLDDYDATFLLRPEQLVQLQMLQYVSGLRDYRKTQRVVQLKVAGLLGAGGLNEVHEADLTPPAGSALPVLGSCAAGAAAAVTTGESCCSSKRLAFKVPLRYTSPLVAPASRDSFPVRSEYYQHCQGLLLKEASIMRQLAGTPGILRCFGVTEASFTTHTGLHYESVCGLLLELAELGDVQKQLTPAPGEVAPMDSMQAWRVMVAAARALHAVHSVAECVYEDLKPANICCTKGASGETEYQLIDFASCIPLHNGRAPAQPIGGTPGFMAAEAAAGQEHSVTADTWSLAALLLVLRTGRPPWYHLEILELPADAAAGRRTYEELLQVPAYCKAFGARELKFLATALNPNWQQRPTVQQLLESDPYMQYGPGDDAATVQDIQDTAAYAVAGMGLVPPPPPPPPAAPGRGADGDVAMA